MALIDRIIAAFTKTHSALPDRPSLTATDLKTWYDQSANELKTQTNGMIADLTATTTEASGADQIGSGPMFTGDVSTATVMGKLKYAYSQFLTVVQGGIAAGSILLSHLAGEVTDYFATKTEVQARALFKAGSGTFPSSGTTCTVTDTFITTTTWVDISPTQEKQGEWTVVSAAGSFTITSDTTETSTVTFDWGATK